MRKFNGEPDPEMRSREALFVRADLVKKPSPFAQERRDAGDGIPGHVAESPQSGERDADLVPIRVQSHLRRCVNHIQPLRGGGNVARVDDVELERCAGSERLRERDGSFAQLAGVVHVRFEKCHREDNVLERGAGRGNADPFPLESRGNLQRNAGQWRLAVVANCELSAHGDVLLDSAKSDVEIEIGEGDRMAFSIFRNRCIGGDDRRLSRVDPHMRGGLPVLVCGAGKQDLASGLLRSRLSCGLLRGSEGSGGLRRRGENCHAGGNKSQNPGN